MKKIYENFTEIANDFKDGDHWTHRLSDHTAEECYPWQHGVMEFAKWLDACGVKIIENPEIHRELWENVRTYKPDNYTKCQKKRFINKYSKIEWQNVKWDKNGIASKEIDQLAVDWFLRARKKISEMKKFYNYMGWEWHVCIIIL